MSTTTTHDRAAAVIEALGVLCYEIVQTALSARELTEQAINDGSAGPAAGALLSAVRDQVGRMGALADAASVACGCGGYETDNRWLHSAEAAEALQALRTLHRG